MIQVDVRGPVTCWSRGFVVGIIRLWWVHILCRLRELLMWWVVTGTLRGAENHCECHWGGLVRFGIRIQSPARMEWKVGISETITGGLGIVVMKERSSLGSALPRLYCIAFVGQLKIQLLPSNNKGPTIIPSGYKMPQHVQQHTATTPLILLKQPNTCMNPVHHKETVNLDLIRILSGRRRTLKLPSNGRRLYNITFRFEADFATS